MAEYNRPAKPVSGDGGTSFVDGNNLPASELNDEFDAIQAVVNGGLDEDNLDGATQIPNSYLVDIAMSKVLDSADDIATYATVFPPGDTGTPLLPTTLLQEMLRLRYRIGVNKNYFLNTFFMDTSGGPAAAAEAAWFEPPIVGPNLLPNPGFELHTAGTPNAPDGWTLLSTPSAIAIENPAHVTEGLEKRSLRILTNDVNEGIQVTIGGLKQSAKYLIGMNYSITAGTINLVTTGGLASGDYQNLALTDATAGAAIVETIQGIVKATTTPGSITVQIYGTAAAADFNIHNVWMYELADGVPYELPSIPTQTATSTTAVTYPTSGWTGSGNTWRTTTISALSLTQYVPFRGYRMRYRVAVPHICLDASAGQKGSRLYGAIQLNIDGGGANTVSGPVFYELVIDSGDVELGGGTMTLEYVLDNPTPGSSYAFTFLLGVYDGSAYEQVSSPPLVGSVQMESRAVLTMERI